MKLTTMMPKHTRFLAMALVVACAAASGAAAQDTKKLASAGEWTAYVQEKEQGKKICYMYSSPKRAEGNYTKRGNIHVIVTHRPAEKSRDEVSVVAGYDYKNDSGVQIKIDDKAFELFTQKDMAWLRTEAEDKEIVRAMIKGKTMVVRGTSQRGTPTKDTYSLIGFTKTYRSISSACGI